MKVFVWQLSYISLTLLLIKITEKLKCLVATFINKYQLKFIKI